MVRVIHDMLSFPQKYIQIISAYLARSGNYFQKDIFVIIILVI